MLAFLICKKGYVKLVYYTYDYRVNRGLLVAECKARAATGSNEYGLADARAYTVNCDNEFIGIFAVFDDMYLEKLVTNEVILLSRRYDITNYYTFKHGITPLQLLR